MVESSGLLNRRRGLNLYRGFESPPLRHLQIPQIVTRDSSDAPRLGSCNGIAASRPIGTQLAPKFRGAVRCHMTFVAHVVCSMALRRTSSTRAAACSSWPGSRWQYCVNVNYALLWPRRCETSLKSTRRRLPGGVRRAGAGPQPNGRSWFEPKAGRGGRTAQNAARNRRRVRRDEATSAGSRSPSRRTHQGFAENDPRTDPLAREMMRLRAHAAPVTHGPSNRASSVR